MLGKIVLLSLLIPVVLLSIIWQVTTPATIGPLGILLVFIFMYLSALGALTFLLFWMNKIVVKMLVMANPASMHGIRNMTLGRSYYFATVIALAPVMVVGMQSVGRVGIYEILLILLFVAISCTYIAKRTN